MRNPQLLAIAILFWMCVGLGQQAALSQPDPVLHPRPPKQAIIPGAIVPPGRIQLDAVVTDAAGKPIDGLNPWDFTVFDNEHPQKILTFHGYDGLNAKPDPPVEIILVIDVANLPFQQVAFVRQQVTKYLRQNGGHLTQPISIILITDTGMRIQPRPSTDGKALASVVDQINGIVGSINPAMGFEGDLQRFQLSVHHLTSIAENEAMAPGRKLLIWIGPGWPILDSANFVSSEQNQQRYFDSIVELSTKLREARTVLYSVAPSNSTTEAGMRTILYQAFLKGVKSPRQAAAGNLALKVLVTETGGRVLGPDNDVAGQISACIAEANSFYRLSFDPPSAAHPNDYHDLKVLVNKQGVVARTFTGYYNQPVAKPN
jgi:VWFA-related protein